MNLTAEKPAILVADDSPSEIRIFEIAARDIPVPFRLMRAGDGEHALSILKNLSDEELPDIIITDLRMPKCDGLSLLEKLDADPRLRKIPTLMMSGTANDDDIRKAYDRHVNCFIRKPIEYEEFHRKVTEMLNFWLTVADLPPSGPPAA
jgi:two-component system, chemotaxis family, response regulator Rcp1